MRVQLPSEITIPRHKIEELPLGTRIRLLFDLIPDGEYLDVIEMAEALGVHPNSIRRTLSDLDEAGLILEHRRKPVNLSNPPKEYLVKSLSKSTNNEP